MIFQNPGNIETACAKGNFAFQWRVKWEEATKKIPFIFEMAGWSALETTSN